MAQSPVSQSGKLVLEVFSWTAPFIIALLSAENLSDSIFYICAKSLQPPGYVFIDTRTPKWELRAQILERATRTILSSPSVLSWVKAIPHDQTITSDFSESGDDLAYNLLTLRKLAGIFLSLLLALAAPLSAQQ